MTEKDLSIKEFLKILGWERKMFYGNIDTICSPEVYDIDKGNFKRAGETKEDYEKDENKYWFKKEWADLAAVLFSMYKANPYYRSNVDVNKVSIDSVLEYYKLCADLIQKNLSDYHRREIQFSLPYKAMVAEIKGVEFAKEKLQLLMTVATKLPLESRASLWVKLGSMIDQLAIMTYCEQITAKEEVNEQKGTVFQDLLVGDFECIGIDKVVAGLLKREMNQRLQDKIKDVMDFSEHLLQVAGVLAELNDDPETKAMVNEEWDRRNAQKTLEETRGQMFDRQISAIEEAAKELRAANIDGVLENLITYHQNLSSDEGTDKQIKNLKLAAEMVKEDIKESGRFKESVEKVFQGISYSVNNRKP